MSRIVRLGTFAALLFVSIRPSAAAAPAEPSPTADPQVSLRATSEQCGVHIYGTGNPLFSVENTCQGVKAVTIRWEGTSPVRNITYRIEGVRTIDRQDRTGTLVSEGPPAIGGDAADVGTEEGVRGDAKCLYAVNRTTHWIYVVFDVLAIPQQGSLPNATHGDTMIAPSKRKCVASALSSQSFRANVSGWVDPD
jgi:hypothetical protein